MSLPRRLVLVTAFLMFVFIMVQPVSAPAQEFEYVDYTVKKGDTLWDITKAHLKDAFQWPLVWRENLRINNPDLIYPGQVIRIPVRALGPDIEKVKPVVKIPAAEEVAAVEISVPGGVAAVEAPKVEKRKPFPYRKRKLRADKASEVASRQFILESGYIARELPNAGTVTKNPRGRMEVAQYDDIYINTIRQVQPGDKFYVVRSHTKVRHPLTGRSVGHMVLVLGTIEVKEAGTRDLKAVVTESFDAIRVGDRLDYYYEVVPPITAGDPRKPDIDAFIIAARYERTLTGKYDVVFIDKGSEDGLMPGDVIMTLLAGTNDYHNSTIQLVNLRPQTALGIILKNEYEVKYGDIVQGIKE